MAKSSRPSQQKRAREKAQQMRQKDKEQRRIEAREKKANTPQQSGDTDPDLEGIQPGPQPRPEWLLEMDSEDAEADK